MDESTTPQAPAPGSPGAFVMPATNADGQPLSAKEQLAALMDNGTWRDAALQPNTAARNQFDELNRRIVEENRAAEQRELAPGGGLEAPKSASEYELGIDVTAGREQAAYDAAIRSWFMEAQVPTSVGKVIVGQVDNLSREHLREGLTDEQRETGVAKHKDASLAALKQIYGAALEEKIALANKYIDQVEAKQPGLKAFLDEHPYIANDAIVIREVIKLAEAHAARAK